MRCAGARVIVSVCCLVIGVKTRPGVIVCMRSGVFVCCMAAFALAWLR